MRFVALQDFFSAETNSQYVAGLSYTVHDPNSKLAEMVPHWANAGKISFTDTPDYAIGVAKLSGKE